MAQSPQVSPGDRYQTHLATSSIVGLFVTATFIFSTLYGLNFYYSGAEDQAIENEIAKLENRASKDVSSGTLFGNNSKSTITESVLGVYGWTMDWVFEIFSILNPIGLLLKPYIAWLAFKNDVMPIYVGMNIFILRPLGWIFTAILIEFIFNYIRGRST